MDLRFVFFIYSQHKEKQFQSSNSDMVVGMMDNILLLILVQVSTSHIFFPVILFRAIFL